MGTRNLNENSYIPFLRNEFWLIFIVKRRNKNESWRPEVDIGEILKLSAWETFTRELLKLKLTHEWLPTVWMLKNFKKWSELDSQVLSHFGILDQYRKNRKAKIFSAAQIWPTALKLKIIILLCNKNIFSDPSE